MRPVNGRGGDQLQRLGRQRHHQPLTASVTSALTMMLMLVSIICDSGQPTLYLYCRCLATGIKFTLGSKCENLYSPEIHPVANNMREHKEKLN